MKIKYCGQTIAKADKRFKEIRWQDGDFTDTRIRKSKSYAKSKRNKRISTFKNELKRTFTLIVILGLITGFIYIQLGGI